MHNGTHCQAKTNTIWEYFLREAKLRLLDAKDATERKEWRRTLRGLNCLIRGNVSPPVHRRPPKSVGMSTANAKRMA
jgi:hypothetical protein